MTTPAPTVSFNANQNVDSGDLVTFTITTSGTGTLVLTQTAGPTVVLTASGNKRTFEMPASMSNGVPTATTVSFRATYGSSVANLSIFAPPHARWRVAADKSRKPVYRRRWIKDVVPPPTSRFAGDPGVGKLRVGANHGSSSGTFTGYPIEWLDERMMSGADPRKHSLVREYSSDIDISGEVASLKKWAVERRVTIHSFKTAPFTITQVASGAADAALATIFEHYHSVPGNIWSIFYHEPEDNFTTLAQQNDYRTASRRIITRAKAAGLTNVAWASPAFMTPFTFQSGSGRDWRVWHPNWNGSAWAFDVVDLDIIDLYNPQVNPVSTTLRNKTWAQAINIFLNKRVADGAKNLPYAIAEHGIYSHVPTLDDNGVTVDQILRDMVGPGAASGLVGSAMWNSDNARYDDANDPGGAKVTAWKNRVLTSPNVVWA